MKLLLDTHAFIWWDSLSGRLSPRALHALTDPANELVLSVASVWEMQIKSQLGKLTLHASLANILDQQQRINHLTFLPVDVPHVLAVANLPPVHRDPFDRILAGQAIVEGAVLVSSDSVFSGYPVIVLW